MSQSPSGEMLQIPIRQLKLDWNNPRLPPEDRKPSMSQRKLALIIERDYNALKIAESISRHEYFMSEPLIAVVEGSKYRVIEGNRRLTALKGLSDESLRDAFAKENRAWSRLDTSKAPSHVPVLVVRDAAAVAPLLGFRHISGIEPWEPYSQAAFIAGLVENGQSLNEVADIVGRSTTEVRSMYRDLDVLRFAAGLGIDPKPARESFGVFTAAMGRPTIRRFIGAEDPRNVDPKLEPLHKTAEKNLAILLSVLFGDSKGKGRVIRDSRQITSLVRVLEDESGRALEVLLETRDLDEALSALNSPEDQLTSAMEAAIRSVNRAAKAWQGALPNSASDQVARLTSSVSELAARLP